MVTTLFERGARVFAVAVCLLFHFQLASAQDCQDICIPQDTIYEEGVYETGGFDSSTTIFASNTQIPADFSVTSFSSASALAIYRRYDEGRTYLVNLGAVDPNTGQREFINCIDAPLAESQTQVCIYRAAETAEGSICSVRDEQLIGAGLPVQNQVVSFSGLSENIQLDIRFVRLGDLVIPTDVFERDDSRTPIHRQYRDFRSVEDLAIFEPPNICNRP